MANQVTETKDNIKIQVWGEDSILETLQHELMELKEKIENARTKGDFGTYKNLILAFKEVVHLVHEEEEKVKWVDMYSHYKTEIDGEISEVVSTWKQRGEDISEHRLFKVEKEIINKPVYSLYYDVSRNDTMKNNNPTTIFYKDKIYYVHTNLKETAEYIKKLIGEDKVNIYGDKTHLGMALSDYLKELNIEVNPMKISTWY